MNTKNVLGTLSICISLLIYLPVLRAPSAAIKRINSLKFVCAVGYSFFLNASQAATSRASLFAYAL
jgi:hypothetical protein